MLEREIHTDIISSLLTLERSLTTHWVSVQNWEAGRTFYPIPVSNDLFGSIRKAVLALFPMVSFLITEILCLLLMIQLKLPKVTSRIQYFSASNLFRVLTS